MLKNGSASLWDIGDGVVCLEFTSKSNSLDEAIISLLGKTIALVKEQYKALVIYNEGQNFSVGANLGTALFAANIAAWGEIEKAIATGQQAYKALKYASFPTVSAPGRAWRWAAGARSCCTPARCRRMPKAISAWWNAAWGCCRVGAAARRCWGGGRRWASCLAARCQCAAKVFEMVSTATTSKSAAQARDYLFLRPSDGITMNRDRLLADAKAKALSLVAGYKPPEPVELQLPGPSGALAMRMAAEGYPQARHRHGP